MIAPSTAPFQGSSTRPVALIFALALALRIAVALWLPAQIVWSDGERYVHVAHNLLEGLGFGSLADNRASVPTQPLLIAAVQALCGGSFRALRLFFAIMGAGTCVLLYFLGRRLFNPRIALLAGVLLAVYPFFVYLSALFEYPQSLFVFVLLLALTLLYRYLDTGERWTLLLAGLAFGVAVLTVPTLMPFLPLLALILWRRPARGWLTAAVIVYLGALAPIGSWTLRNVLAYGEPILVNKAGGVNFWTANNETYYRFGKDAVVPMCGINRATAFCQDNRAIHLDLLNRGLSEDALIGPEEKASWQRGLQFIRDDPARFAVLTVRKFVQFWGPDPDAVSQNSAQAGSFRVWMARIAYLPVLALALASVAVPAVRRRWRRLVPILLLILVLSTPYYFFLPTTRYRLPIDMFMILLAAACIAHVLGVAGPMPPATRRV